MKLKIVIICLFTIMLYNCNQKTISPRFNHVMLYTVDLESTVNVYTSAFDLKVTNHLKKLKRTQEDGSVSEVEVNIALLKFAGQDFVFEIAEIPNLSQTNNPEYNVYQHIGIDVVDIESASKRILKADGEVLRPIETVEMNGLTTKHKFFKGPNGETIELMQIISGKF